MALEPENRSARLLLGGMLPDAGEKRRSRLCFVADAIQRERVAILEVAPLAGLLNIDVSRIVQ